MSAASHLQVGSESELGQNPSSALPGGATILIADDDEGVRSLLSRLLLREGYVVHVVSDGFAVLDHLKKHPPDVAVLDIVMPGVNGINLCRQTKNDPVTRLVPVVLITGLDSRDQRLEGIAAGADEFLSKPVDTGVLLTKVRSLVRMKRYTDDFESAASVMMTLATMIEARDGSSEGHCHRMANYAAALGQKLGATSDESQVLRRGGFLHDIGMLAVPDSVLHKAGALEPDEYALVQSHTVIGDSLLANLRSLQAVRPIVRHHHERFDGSGYPDGLRGDDIPLFAQIIGLVDAYESMTCPKPYQQVWPVDTAMEVLGDQARRGWRRKDLVDHFVSIVRSRGIDDVPHRY